MMSVKTGVAELIIPATAESRVCSASANSSAGPALPATATMATAVQSARSMRFRAPDNTNSAPAPRVTRSQATTPGASESSPIAIHRKAEPQINPTATTRAQSRTLNAPDSLPELVVM